MRTLTVRERNEPNLKDLCLAMTGAIEHMQKNRIIHTHLEFFQPNYKICDFWKGKEMSKTYETARPGAPIVHASPSTYTRFVAPELRRR
jgi:hypothetical protein